MDTVRDVLDAYLLHSQSAGIHGARATADRRFTLGLFKDRYGDMPAADMRPHHLTDFIEARPHWRTTQTKRVRASGILAAFAWAAKESGICRNPLGKAVPEISDEEWSRLLRVASKPLERALRFLSLTGCRVPELCSAKWGDVDLDLGIWTLPARKSGSPRNVVLAQDAVALLRQVRALGLSEVIFTTTLGRPWTEGNLTASLVRLSDKHGLDCRSWHSIRRRATICNGTEQSCGHSAEHNQPQAT